MADAISGYARPTSAWSHRGSDAAPCANASERSRRLGVHPRLARLGLDDWRPKRDGDAARAGPAVAVPFEVKVRTREREMALAKRRTAQLSARRRPRVDGPAPCPAAAWTAGQAAPAPDKPTRTVADRVALRTASANEHAARLAHARTQDTARGWGARTAGLVGVRTPAPKAPLPLRRRLADAEESLAKRQASAMHAVREGTLPYPRLVGSAWTNDAPVPLEVKAANRSLERKLADARTKALESARAKAEAARARREGRAPRQEWRFKAGAAARPQSPVALREWVVPESDHVLEELVEAVVSEVEVPDEVVDELVSGAVREAEAPMIAEASVSGMHGDDNAGGGGGDDGGNGTDALNDESDAQPEPAGVLRPPLGVSTRLYEPTWMRPPRVFAFDSSGRPIPPRRLAGMLHERAQRLRARAVRPLGDRSRLRSETLASTRRRHDFEEEEEEEEVDGSGTEDG